jgi:glycosyltransferase involved in cell wall biosynthesis
MRSHDFSIHFMTMVFGHHSKYSGYHKFLDYIDHEPFVGFGASKFVTDKFKHELIERSLRTDYHYGLREIDAEIEILGYLSLYRKHLFHFIYGENCFCYSGNFNRRNKILVASYHWPESWFRQQGEKGFAELTKRMSQVDAAVAVSTSSRDFLQQFTQNVFYVPHGIDVDFFTPGTTGPCDPNFCLFVGNWLRDFDTLKTVARILRSRLPQIRIEVVTPERNRHHFEGTGITVHSGISDEELRTKYRQATVLIQPLIDCTANNSALEAMACGLPVVATDVGGIRDYLTDECAVFCTKGDADEMADAVLTLFQDEGKRIHMGTSARIRAEEKFAWPIVAKQMVDVYRKLV